MSERRRLSPEDRRREILRAARALFAERPFTAVSAPEVAAAAGVGRSLVHHYFGSMRELFLAVAAEGVAELSAVETAAEEVPLPERTAHNVHVGFDALEEARETWLAVVGQSGAFGDPELGALFARTAEHSVERTLEMNGDVLDDTPETRFALRCFQALINAATLAWLTGEVGREQAERLVVLALTDFLDRTIPAFATDPGPDARRPGRP